MNENIDISSKTPTDFQLYRYQLSVITNRHPNLIGDNPSDEELKEQRNAFMREMLHKLKDIEYNKWKVRFTPWYGQKDENQFLFLMEASKPKSVVQDFQKKMVANTPYVWLAIDTHDDYQVIAIEQGKEISPDMVISKLTMLLQEHAKHQGYTFIINSIKNSQSFWDYVKANDKNLSAIRFTISPPNLPDLSDCIGKDIRDFIGSIGGKQARFETVARKGEVLDLSESNKKLSKLVKFADMGGGDYSFRRKSSKRFDTPKHIVRTVTAEPAEEETLIPNSADAPKGILAIIRNIFASWWDE